MSLTLRQQPLIRLDAGTFAEMPIDEVNQVLAHWDHYLGPINRPFGMQGWGFEIREPRTYRRQLLSVAVSASAVSATVAGFARGEVVELARLCSDPQSPWVTRVMLRIWRELLAERWPYWPIKAAIAYSQNARHGENVYRFDGWEKVTEKAGSGGGGAWSRKRYATDAAYGPKTLWLWRYAWVYLGEDLSRAEVEARLHELLALEKIGGRGE